MDLNKLNLGDKIVAGTGIVLLISLLFFPWHDISFFGFSETRSAIQSPNGFWGIIALLLTIVVAGSVIASKLFDVALPDLPIPWPDAHFFGSIAVLAVLVLKLVLETEFLGWGAWLSLLLAAGMAFGGFQIKQLGASAGSTPPQAF